MIVNVVELAQTHCKILLLVLIITVAVIINSVERFTAVTPVQFLGKGLLTQDAATKGIYHIHCNVQYNGTMQKARPRFTTKAVLSIRPGGATA